MLTASAGSTVRISTILSTGTAGITILIFMILTIHGIPRPGQYHGTGDGDIAGIHLITVTGTDLIMATMAGVIPTVHGMEAVGM